MIGTHPSGQQELQFTVGGGKPPGSDVVKEEKCVAGSDALIQDIL